MAEQPVPIGVDQDLEAIRIVEDREDRAPAAASPRRRRRRGGWVYVAVALGVLGAGGFALTQRLEPPTVALTAVTVRDLGVPPVVLTAVGYATPERQITVSAKTQGRIVEMPVHENQRVSKGDLIARLDDQEVRANLDLAAAQLMDALRARRRARRLAGQNVGSKATLDTAETAYQVAKARHALAQVALQNTILRAPFDGTIIRKIRDVGEFLTLGVTASGDPGTAAVTLADLDPMLVDLEINETDIRKLSVGMSTLIIPEARPSRRYLGEVIDVAARADRRKGIIPVRVEVLERDRDLLPDMTVKVRFLVEPPAREITTQPTLPREAIMKDKGREVVFVVEGETVKSRPVTTGDVSGDYVAILDGPQEGDFVVAKPADANLVDGQRISIAP